MTVQSITERISSITRNDGHKFKVGECVSITPHTKQGIIGFCVEKNCTSDNELTMANSDKKMHFVASACVTEIEYTEILI